MERGGELRPRPRVLCAIDRVERETVDAEEVFLRMRLDTLSNVDIVLVRGAGGWGLPKNDREQSKSRGVECQQRVTAK